VKDRTECFNDYSPCLKEHCRLNHVKAWLNISSVYYNLVRRHMTFEALLCNPTEKLEFTTLQVIATKDQEDLNLTELEVPLRNMLEEKISPNAFKPHGFNPLKPAQPATPLINI